MTVADSSDRRVGTAPLPRPKKLPINWISTTIIVVPPLLALSAALAGVSMQSKTLILAIVFYFINGFGITMGYHRYFSHRAFTAHWTLEWIMAFCGAGAFQGSIKWWGRNHRIHHRYVDTEKDPYNATRGFWYTHVGWMLRQQEHDKLGRVDISDFASSRMIAIQHKHYLPIALLSGVILPTVIAGLGWGDWFGGYFYAALLKMVVVHHSTFCINSLAHSSLFGAEQNFSMNHTSHDSLICAFLTLGEGFHNFHHEFAQDYRNGLKWYDWDPTKWIIRGCEMLGMAWNLVRVPNEVILRNIYGVKHKKASMQLAVAQSELQQLEKKTIAPTVYTWSEFTARVAQGAKLMVVGDYVLDMEKRVPTGSGYTHSSRNIIWYEAHPGGRKMLDMFVGKDATEAMSGGIYKHSEGAFNLLQHLRVATIKREKTE